MKLKHLLLALVMLLLTALTGIAQNINDVKPSLKDVIPFGKKLPPPDLTNHPDKYLPNITAPNINTPLMQDLHHPGINTIRNNFQNRRQQLMDKIKLRDKIKVQSSNFPENVANADQSFASSLNSNFHLIKDINALAESYPHNNPSLLTDIHFNVYNDSASYAVLDNVAYFVADDGIHGNEFWRSDGTATGTYMVKDIEPGLNSSAIFDITAVNGKIYFTDYSEGGAWVSDGTESGTQLLINLGEPVKYFTMGNKVYFIADDDIGDPWATIWETDGTTAGTKQVITLGDTGVWISEPTVVNGIFFFTMLTYETGGWNLWRSNGTETGTYSIASFPAFDTIPAQLTNYNNKLYFSASDGTGRKLWVSDGTDAGTTPAPGNNDVIIDADKLGTTFPILNNVLYIPGEEASEGNGLYKYNASDAAGLVKVKDLAPVGDTAFIVPFEMQAVNNTLYFKVISYNGGVHDELWSSKGTKTSTQLVYKLKPDETLKNLCNGSGTLYFVKSDKLLGAELWRTFETFFGIFPVPVSDIFRGPTSSYPSYLTAFNGKLIFSAADEKKGNELFITGGNFFNTTLVKDINTVATSSSNAGFNFYNYLGYSGMAALGKDVLFDAYERVHGAELYKSDGTEAGTKLLNDVIPGEAGFNINEFLSKNNAAYFISVSNNGSSIYKTNGTKNSLRKITIDYPNIQSFNVADDGLVFYVLYNSNTSAYELWRTDGTAAGTLLLSSTLYSRNYLNVIGNTALFVAGDATNGYELWKSDGSMAGTAIVKDINPGVGNSTPGGMFIYKNEVYFSAYDGTSPNPSFWKSNGTEAGTIKLKDIELWWGNNVALTGRDFAISNNILYFSAINHSDAQGTVFWKTDGTPAGTQPIKDINPTSSAIVPGPLYLTDVNGTLFFTADDGVNGRELWKSDGTAVGTQLVKDITTGPGASNMAGLTSFAGKLYFQNAENNRYYLWSSDGTAEGTEHVADPGITNVGIAAIFSSGDKLFLSGNTHDYGTELYVGKSECGSEKFTAVSMTNKAVISAGAFNAVLYPNPASSKASLQISGNAKNVSVSITDMSGRKLWQSNNSNTMLVNLPIEKYAAGIYLVKVTSGNESKTIKLVKQ